MTASSSEARPSPTWRRVSPLELLFDLVFVFAFTQVTSFMSDRHSGIAVLEAMAILALLWWTWAGYSWLGNHIQIDEGITRLVFVLAIIATFFLGLSIPAAFIGHPGQGTSTALLLAASYAAVRFIHVALYLVAARGDRALQRQIRRTSVAMFTGVIFVTVGALVGGSVQIWLWLAGVVLDFVLTYWTSIDGGWQVRSATHWAERYGLVVMLAIGESVIAVRVGVNGTEPSPLALTCSGLAVILSISMWWLYFDSSSRAGEQQLERLDAKRRAALATDAYTYIHFPLIAGIIISALGIEVALTPNQQQHPLGLFGSLALYEGTALFAFALAMFRRRIGGRWKRLGVASASLLAIAGPAASLTIPSIGLSALVAFVFLLVLSESFAYRRCIATVRR